MPIARWPEETASQAFPWSAFIAARRSLENSDLAGAVDQWRQVLAANNLESRHHLQAWHFLRQHGQPPAPEVATNLLGVVIEVGMPKGLDLLAAYTDYSARYYNFSGAGVVWEHPDNSLDALIDSLLNASREVVAKIGPWDKERPAPPPSGQMRLSFLTPSGLHFGQGPISALASDPIGGRVVQAATQLMQALTAKAGVS